MKINIRSNTFETNSSAVHAIVISNEPPYEEGIFDGVGFINAMSFSDIAEFWDSAEVKLAYVYSAAQTDNDSSFDWDSYLIEVLDLDPTIGFERGGQLLMEFYDAPQHLLELFKEDPDALYNFVYSKNSYVETSRDGAFSNTVTNDSWGYKEIIPTDTGYITLI